MVTQPANAYAPPTLPRRSRKWMAIPFVIPLAVSLFSHGTAAGLLLFDRAGGGGSHGGDQGNEGAGDRTVDITIAGASAAAASPPAPDPAQPTPPPEMPTSTAETDKPDPIAKDEPPPQLPIANPVPPPTTVDHPQTESQDKPALGTGAAETSGGRAPGSGDALGFGDAPESVEGQRSKLPPSAKCDDPVAGRWEAFKYNSLGADWVRFTLLINRSSDGALTGSITSHLWNGTPLDATPPACDFDHFEYLVSMNARGHADGTRITFGASTYSIVSVQCPMPGFGYAPDNFSGVIDPARQEFQSVNNDGSRDINAPYVFRRTGCLAM